MHCIERDNSCQPVVASIFLSLPPLFPSLSSPPSPPPSHCARHLPPVLPRRPRPPLVGSARARSVPPLASLPLPPASVRSRRVLRVRARRPCPLSSRRSCFPSRAAEGGPPRGGSARCRSVRRLVVLDARFASPRRTCSQQSRWQNIASPVISRPFRTTLEQPQAALCSLVLSSPPSGRPCPCQPRFCPSARAGARPSSLSL